MEHKTTSGLPGQPCTCVNSTSELLERYLSKINSLLFILALPKRTIKVENSESQMCPLLRGSIVFMTGLIVNTGQSHTVLVRMEGHEQDMWRWRRKWGQETGPLIVALITSQ